jgi:hypothetical protein
MQRELRVNLPQQLFQPIDELAVPGHEFGVVVDVRRRVDLVLLEPPRHPARRGVGAGAWVEAPVQLKERIA